MNHELEPTSTLLHRIADEALADDSSDQITLGEFIDKLADRGFGVLMLLCALPNFFPVNVPGISTIFSVILILLVGQWMMGREHPWLPGFIRKRHMSEKKFASGLQPIIPKLKKVEQVIKPRMSGIFHRLGVIFVGLCLLLQIGFLALPLAMIPFSNAIPAYFIAAIAIGIITHDGLFTVVISIIATVAICLFGVVIIEVVAQLWAVAVQLVPKITEIVLYSPALLYLMIYAWLFFTVLILWYYVIRALDKREFKLLRKEVEYLKYTHVIWLIMASYVIMSGRGSMSFFGQLFPDFLCCPENQLIFQTVILWPIHLIIITCFMRRKALKLRSRAES